jgi:fused signal recognition particle receptor
VFDLLKKKISGFVEKITGKEKEEGELGKAEARKEALIVEEKVKIEEPEAIPEKKMAEPAAEPAMEEEAAEEKPEIVEEPEEIVEEKPELPAKEVPEVIEKKEEKEKTKAQEKKGEKPELPVKKEEKEAPVKEEAEKKGAPAKKERAQGAEESVVGKMAEKAPERLEKKIRKNIFAAVKETISGTSEIKEGEIGELLEELEIGLIESDVSLDVAEGIKEELRGRVVGAKVKKGNTAEFIREQLRQTLMGIVGGVEGFSLPERIRALDKPVKIMVMGPNGSGKTTTIAKIIHLLKGQGISSVVAAADTFRAAAAEQLCHHGEKLGVRVIAGKYGSDPTALAYDAVEYAKAHGIDAVIIDTAGRQDTNVNLLNQLKKMGRVIKPQLKIYVGESIAGNAITEQISIFSREIGLDGVVLTKLDCDAKGGTVISVSKTSGLPILYVGTGQGYGDLEPFDAGRVIGEILS